MARPALVLAMLFAGCIPVTDFNPVGSDSSISGAWTVDGAAPTDASCRNLLLPFSSGDPSIPKIRIAFLDGDRAVVHSGLVFECFQECLDGGDCMSGSFDTADNRVVAAGDWTIRYEAIDPAGRVVAVGPANSYTAQTQGALPLNVAPFYTGVISATVVIDGETPTPESCRTLGVARLQLVFDAAGGVVANTDLRESCSAGGIGTRVEPGTQYVVRLRTLDGSNNLVAETAPFVIDMHAGEHVVLQSSDGIELTAL